MTDQLSAALQFAKDNRHHLLKQLKTFTSIPSISTDPKYKQEIERAATWLRGYFNELGISAQILPTDGYPIVYAKSMKAGKDKPTVLIYGHYDVQPPDPLEQWETPPFEASIRGENLYARGATDMKGSILAVLEAVKAVTESGQPPVNFKFILEGEEEKGSVNLESFIINNKETLTSDFALNPDTGMIAPDIPAITYGLRGVGLFELTIQGPSHDLHSGLFGGVIQNPTHVLCALIAGMHDENGRITLPGFYDKVRPMDEKEKAELARLPMNTEETLNYTGAPKLWGESGYSPNERVGARPTLEVNGIFAGYTGEGFKTVLPAEAVAKISTRLVPDQEPEDVYKQLLQYLDTHSPDTVVYKLEKSASAVASISDINSPEVKAMQTAMETVWKTQPVFVRGGGTIPVVGYLKKILGIDSVNCGLSLPDDNLHAPNEKIHLPTLHRGVDAFIHFFFNLVDN